jgi:hypothetical protein
MPEAIEARMETSPTDLSTVADRVEDGERVVIKIGTKEFAVISMEDLEFIEDIENKLDLLAALQALQEAAENDPKFIPLEKIIEDLKKERSLPDGL